MNAPVHAPVATRVHAFELDDVSKRYGMQWAIARLSFRLEPGEALLLTGPNGSGKTTLLRLLATATSPTSGRVRVLGFEGTSQAAEIRRRTALLAHANFIYEDLSASQNLRVLARLLGIADVDQSIEATLVRVGLKERSDTPVRHFSAGMRKRLAVARLLLKKPLLVLLDEPFGELDPTGAREMEKIIAEFLSQGSALVLATHLIEQGLALCNRRLHLENGRAVSA
jgi:heme exporter protein A